jgi:hypothetical protein
MKYSYSSPKLVEYGLLDQLTLGSSSTVPDINQNGNTVGVGCQTDITGNFTRTSCAVITSS